MPLRALAFTWLPLVVCLGAGVIGGVFFAFSTFVMPALAQLPAREGAAAMQRINVVVLNPLFLGVFMGTALLAALALPAALILWDGARSLLLLAAGLSYVLGSFGVTVARNVPRNERLARLASDSAAAADYWPVYVREWQRWNHVRTAASIASCAFAAGALAW